MNINQALESYSQLKGVQGHFQGGTHDPRVDNFGELKHNALKTIQEHYGRPGQDATEIIKKLGQPDKKELYIPELAREEGKDSLSTTGRISGGQMAPMLPNLGPFVGEGTGNETSGEYYLIYHWRGNHDYVYFKVDASTDKVTKSGWYNALD